MNAHKTLADFSVEDWVAGYEMRGDQDYKPSEDEQCMLIDFAHGLLAELEDRLSKTEK